MELEGDFPEDFPRNIQEKRWGYPILNDERGTLVKPCGPNYNHGVRHYVWKIIP